MSDTAPSKPSKAPAATAPQRVKLVNKNSQNGQLDAVATPLESDVQQWLARGWAKADT